MKRFLIFLLSAVLVLLVFFIYKFSFKKEYKFATAKYRTLVKAVYASGRVVPVNQVDVKSEVSGYIEKLLIDNGTEVRRGQVIAIIKHGIIDKSIEETEKKIKRLEEKLRPDSEFRRVFLKRIDIKKKELELLKRKLDRRLPLYRKKQVSEEEIETLKNRIETKEEEIRLLDTEYRDKVRELETQLNILRVVKDRLLEERERYFIKSPVDGIVLKKYVEEGEYLNHMLGKNIIATVGDLENLKTVLEVDEEYVPLIKKGMTVFISIDAFPKRVFKGKIIKITDKSDPVKRTVEVEASVSYPVKLPSGTTVEANIILDKRKVLSLPVEAVVEGKVKVLENGKIKIKNIKTGISSNGYVEITEGLKKGERVVLP